MRRGNATREEKLAVCTGGVKLPAPDLAEILSVVAFDSDELISTRAQESILALPIENFVEALHRQQALEPLFEFAAKNLAAKPGIADALIKNKNCPAEHLVPLVQHLSALGVQSLMDELDRVSDSRELAEALEKSTSITLEQKSQLNELLSDAMPDMEALADALADAEPDNERRKTLLQQISTMTVAQRVQFAMKGGSEARRTLIRDNNKVVHGALHNFVIVADERAARFGTALHGELHTLRDGHFREALNESLAPGKVGFRRSGGFGERRLIDGV